MIGSLAVASPEAHRGRQLLFEHLQLFADELGAPAIVRLFGFGKVALQLYMPTAVFDLRTRIEDRTRVAEIVGNAQLEVSRGCLIGLCSTIDNSHQVMDMELLAGMRQQIGDVGSPFMSFSRIRLSR